MYGHNNPVVIHMTQYVLFALAFAASAAAPGPEIVACCPRSVAVGAVGFRGLRSDHPRQAADDEGRRGRLTRCLKILGPDVSSH